ELNENGRSCLAAATRGDPDNMANNFGPLGEHHAAFVSNVLNRLRYDAVTRARLSRVQTVAQRSVEGGTHTKGCNNRCWRLVLIARFGTVLKSRGGLGGGA